MSKKVLIVDDSPSMRQMVSFTLQDAGYEVIEAGDGVAAVGKLAGDLKLIVSDVNMPGMNGIELTKKVRENAATRFVPVLILTTESDPAKKEEGKKAGATGWLVKPFQPDALLDTVRKMVG